MAISSKDFDTFMNQLCKVQYEMQQQVENTTKILEMINVVAKNTRILDFNASIEAAVRENSVVASQLW